VFGKRHGPAENVAGIRGKLLQNRVAVPLRTRFETPVLGGLDGFTVTGRSWGSPTTAAVWGALDFRRVLNV
jgi:hypothetical protein